MLNRNAHARRTRLNLESLDRRDVPATVTWTHTGSSPGYATNAANWSTVSLPGSGDIIVLPSGTTDCIWDTDTMSGLPSSLGEVDLQSGYGHTFELTGGTELDITNVSVESGDLYIDDATTLHITGDALFTGGQVDAVGDVANSNLTWGASAYAEFTNVTVNTVNGFTLAATNDVEDGATFVAENASNLTLLTTDSATISDTVTMTNFVFEVQDDCNVYFHGADLTATGIEADGIYTTTFLWFETEPSTVYGWVNLDNANMTVTKDTTVTGGVREYKGAVIVDGADLTVTGNYPDTSYNINILTTTGDTSFDAQLQLTHGSVVDGSVFCGAKAGIMVDAYATNYGLIATGDNLIVGDVTMTAGSFIWAGSDHSNLVINGTADLTTNFYVRTDRTTSATHASHIQVNGDTANTGNLVEKSSSTTGTAAVTNYHIVDWTGAGVCTASPTGGDGFTVDYSSTLKYVRFSHT